MKEQGLLGWRRLTRITNDELENNMAKYLKISNP